MLSGGASCPDEVSNIFPYPLIYPLHTPLGYPYYPIMRGITPSERDQLALLALPDDFYIPVGEHEATYIALVATGRATVYTEITGEDDKYCYSVDIYDITLAGRMALRLWPATKAAPKHT